MIKIRIKDANGVTTQCLPYDYDKYPGETFEKSIKIPIKGLKPFDELLKINEIHIFLKLTPGTSIDRPPYLVSKLRRVNDLCQFKSFRTNHKRDIWNHPSITGYIDTKDLLNPTLARNDFKNDKNFKLVRKAILDTEEEILAKFKEVIAAASTSDFSELESDFNSKLESLIDFTSEDKKTLGPGDILKVSDTGESLINVLIPDEHGSITSEFAIGKRKSGRNKKSNKNEPSDSKSMINMEHSREFVIHPRSNKKSLILKIDDTSEPIKDNEGKEKRSELFGNTVHIYKKHPDFNKRISTNSLSIEIISSELIIYLASEMLIHYTNFSFEQSKKDKYTERKEVLIFFTDWLYKLEDSLKRLIGQPLSK